MKKRIFSLLLVCLFTFALTGCNDSQSMDDTFLSEVLSETANFLVKENPDPECGAVGGEWVVFGLAKWDDEMPEDAWFERYYAKLESHVENCKGVLDTRKYTEYSRVILALNAMGKDPTDVAGYNLLEPLADFDQTVFQGINGPAYALMALDSGNYQIPSLKNGDKQATRELYVNYLLDKELENGGWSLSGNQPEADMTAIVLQALANYQDRDDVKDAIDRGIQALSDLQGEDGGYIAFETDSSETISQVVVALCKLGVSMDDARFVKDGKTLADRLLEYRTEDGGFRHTMDGEKDLMATEQAFYALVDLYQTQII